jgi:hypothetical protein
VASRLACLVSQTRLRLDSFLARRLRQGVSVPSAERGHLSELGIIAERGLLGLAELVAIVRDETGRACK